MWSHVFLGKGEGREGAKLQKCQGPDVQTWHLPTPLCAAGDSEPVPSRQHAGTLPSAMSSATNYIDFLVTNASPSLPRAAPTACRSQPLPRGGPGRGAGQPPGPEP